MSKATRTALSDIQCTVYSVCLRLRPGGGDSVRCLVGVCHHTGTLKPFLSAAHAHTAYTMGVQPPDFELFCNHQELFNVTSNLLFFVLQVWQDFIRDVVLRLLSRSTNFHSSKHTRNYTQDGLVNLRST